MTFRIAEDYFVNNLSDEESNFALADGFYSRTIQQDDLTLAFDMVDDGELQNYFSNRNNTSFSYHS